MRKNKGAALIVVLSLLSISLMVGLSSMQSSQIDERLAGNYRASADAQMRAESAAADLLMENEKSLWVDFGPDDLPVDFSWVDFSSLAQGDGSGGEGSCMPDSVDDRLACYVEISDKDYADELGVETGKYIIAMASVPLASSFSEYILVKIGSGLPALTEVDSAVLCSGGGCFYEPGSGKASPSVDGKNRFKDGKTQGANKPMLDDRWPDGAGIVMPDIDAGNGAGSGGGGYEGAPGEVYSVEGFENDIATVSERGEKWEDAKVRIEEYVSGLVNFVKEGGGGEGLYYAGSGEVVSPGSAEGVVIIDGGTLSLGGNDAFRGLVVMNGGEILSSGTPAIVGAVLGINYTFSGNGTPSIYFSMESLVSAYGGDFSGGGERVEYWR